MITALPWLLLLICLTASFFFSGIEMGLLSVNRLRLAHRLARNEPRAALIQWFLERPERFLGTALAGNNVSNLLASAIVTTLLIQASWWPGVEDIAATLLLTPVVLIFCEILPKVMFRRHADEWVGRWVVVLKGVYHVLYPLIAFIIGVSRSIGRTLGIVQQEKSLFVTREELRFLVLHGEQDADLRSDDRRMVGRVFDFEQRHVQEVMTPRVRTVAVSDQTSVEQLKQLVREKKLSRIPVWQGQPDQMIGVVNIFDILFDPAPRTDIQSYIRPVFWVEPQDVVGDVFELMQKQHQSLAVVRGVKQGWVGVVTLEDLVEEIVGEIEG